MGPERFERIRGLFDEASELSPGERTAFLERQCGSDAEMRREVADLLAAAENSQGLFANASNAFEVVGGPREALPHVFQVGETLADRFQIVRYIGRGGMGEVYEAMDCELGESIAIKTLRYEFVTNPAGLRRFKREIQLARKVAHRNVCTVFDIARHRGAGQEYTFLSMELLDGITLAAYLKQKEKLNAQEALPLIRQMSAGLDALHQEGIVHRDFKPGNVMLVGGTSERQRVVVTDFGLARTVAGRGEADTEVSRPGELLGTLDYMAPEQFSTAPAGPAADVYAFGLVLYRMLAGHHAYEGHDAIQIGVSKATQLPKPIQEYVPELDGRWAQAIGRCLERDPARRFASAGEAVRMIEGLSPAPSQREVHLATVQGEGSAPRSEPPPHRRPRLRTVLAAMASLLLLLLLSAAFPSSVATLFRAVGIRFNAPLPSEIRLAVLPIEATGVTRLSRESLDGLTEAVTARAVDIELLRKGLVVIPSQEVLKEVRMDLGSADALSAEDPPPVHERAPFPIADAAGKLGANAVFVMEIVQLAGDLRWRVELLDPAGGRLFEADDFTLDAADLAAAEGRLVSTLAAMLDVDPATLRAAEEKENQRPDYGEAYAFYLQGRGYLARHDKIENVEKAIQLFHHALGENAEYALAYAGLGEAYWRKYQRRRDPDDARLALQDASLGVRYGPDEAQAYVSLGLVHMGTSRSDEALADFHKAVELDPRNPLALSGLAKAYETSGALVEAERTFIRAIELRPNLWTSHKELALFYYRQARYEDAIQQYEVVLQQTPASAHAMINLGGFHYMIGRRAEAKQYWEQSLTIERRTGAIANLAKFAFDEGRYDAAISLYLEILERDRLDYRVWGSLGGAYLRTGDLQRSREAHQHAVSLVEDVLEVSPANAGAMLSLAHYKEHLGDSETSQALISRALKISLHEPRLLVQAAETHAVAGRIDESLRLIRRAVDMGYSVQQVELSPNLGPIYSRGRLEWEQRPSNGKGEPSGARVGERRQPESLD